MSPALSSTRRAEQTDLIVMSTHGYCGLTRWVLGSVTEKVLRGAPCPIMAVRAARRPQRVLITLDGSTLGEQAIGPGLSLAQSLKADVMLLRCVLHIVTNGKLDEHERRLSRSVTAKMLRSVSCSMPVIRPADAELN